MYKKKKLGDSNNHMFLFITTKIADILILVPENPRKGSKDGKN